MPKRKTKEPLSQRAANNPVIQVRELEGQVARLAQRVKETEQQAKRIAEEALQQMEKLKQEALVTVADYSGRYKRLANFLAKHHSEVLVHYKALQAGDAEQ